MQPLLKWAGGKEKELKYILPAMPEFRRYFEPFVGGGAVYAAVDAAEYYINDLSTELINFYRYLAGEEGSEMFFRYVDNINTAWNGARELFTRHRELLRLYTGFRDELLTKDMLDMEVSYFCRDFRDEILGLAGDRFNDDPDAFIREIRRTFIDKMSRMKKLELTKSRLSEKDLSDNIETAVKGALYMYFRHLYNDNIIEVLDPAKHCALFLFIRNYCYSGMFRYNSDGKFNVPYGGIAYNGKNFDKKMEYYKSSGLSAKLAATHICNLDFEKFLIEHKPDEDDFIFLDPPYDSEFSTYANNEFTRDDQKRLADYLTGKCVAKWMMVIKHTDYIYGLYDRPGINILTFDKSYLVSFMNRNDRKVKHLLITNY